LGVDLEGKPRLDVPPDVVQRAFPRTGQNADVLEATFQLVTEYARQETAHLIWRSGAHGAFSEGDDGSD
jgi:hypothetical protein